MDFQTLLRAYPKEKIMDGCASHSNQCAIRLSRALIKAGFEDKLHSYKEPTCRANGKIHARGAESLANFLWISFKPAKKLKPEEAEEKITGKKGIIFFRNIEGFRDGRGDHIDLWNGKETITGSYFSRCQEVWFWSLT